jgi:hypothetical protein
MCLLLSPIRARLRNSRPIRPEVICQGGGPRLQRRQGLFGRHEPDFETAARARKSVSGQPFSTAPLCL